MYVAIYRWKLKPGQEQTFIDHWDAGTGMFVNEQGAWGSRLHLADDGTYFAYAQWPSRELYHAKRTLSPEHQQNLEKMRACVEESQTTILGDVVYDRLIKEPI